jgi:hypothetical protein
MFNVSADCEYGTKVNGANNTIKAASICLNLYMPFSFYLKVPDGVIAPVIKQVNHAAAA